jgi:hypothetical protein
MEPETSGDCGRILERRGPPDSIMMVALGGSGTRYLWTYRVPEGERLGHVTFIFSDNNAERELRLVGSSGDQGEGKFLVANLPDE